MSPRDVLKWIAAKLPAGVQNELKRLQFAREMRKGRFVTDEKEFSMLDRWVDPGDWVLDVGANIGHYTSRLSELVGESGRVVAFEPVPATFELLAANVSRLRHRNVTLLNVAASDRPGSIGMSIPKFDTGLDNYYMAHLTDDDAALHVVTLPIDSLGIQERVSLVKIDAEGHDLQVLRGMQSLLKRCQPVLITESDDPGLESMLSELGYTGSRLQNSSNVVYEVRVDADQEPSRDAAG